MYSNFSIHAHTFLQHLIPELYGGLGLLSESKVGVAGGRGIIVSS